MLKSLNQGIQNSIFRFILRISATLCFLVACDVVFADENHGPEPEVEIETLRFYDWEVAASDQTESKKICHLQLTGVSRQRILITLRLSTVKEHPSASARNAITMIKISADQINKVDLSDTVPIALSNAWIETSTVSTLGELEKIEVASEPYFLGASKGTGLFMQALKGIQKEGLIIGYRSKGQPIPKIFEVTAPPPQIFEQLQHCFSKNTALSNGFSADFSFSLM